MYEWAEEMSWVQDVVKRYPFDDGQKQELRALHDCMYHPFGSKPVCIDGSVYWVKNKNEFQKANEEAENRKYLCWGKCLTYRQLKEANKRSRENMNDVRNKLAQLRQLINARDADSDIGKLRIEDCFKSLELAKRWMNSSIQEASRFIEKLNA